MTDALKQAREAQDKAAGVADARIKAMYVAQVGSEDGWLGIEGSYFIGGVRAAERADAAQAAPPAPAAMPTYLIGDLRDAKWLDPECADAGACQSLKFKAAQAKPAGDK